MKNILKLSASLILFIAFFSGCKKEETKLYFTGGTPPALSMSASSDSVSYLNADKIVLTINWTNPDYNFTTGVSSLDVTYKIQIDTVGSDFTNPNMKVISVNKDLSYSFTASALNIIMQDLNLVPAVQHNLEIRVVSNLTNNSAVLTSNSVQYSTTPYVIPPKVNPPLSGELYLVGSATDGGWNNPVPTPSQQFTKIDDLHFTLTVYMHGGQQYLFIPVNGDWSHKFACKKTADQLKDGGEFGLDFSDNFPGPDADGTYTIAVDFQKGKYTVTQ
ncbi:MAG: SusE domain-containing protein [Parafilimonas sp.]